jgi:predicted ATPase
MRITRLELANWKNFKAVSVVLDQRTFFLGPNASGKSNLLDAFRFLRDLVVAGGGLQEAVRSRGGVGELRAFAATSNVNLRLLVEIGDDETPNQWTYELLFRANKTDKLPVIVSEKVVQGEQTLLNRPDDDDHSDPDRLRSTALEQINANKDFRTIAEFFGSIRYLNPVPQIVRDPRRSIGRDDPHGGDLIDRINATPKRSRDARLKRMEVALQIAVPQLSELELDVDTKGLPHLRAKYKHWRPAGAWQREHHFSDGTLRLLGLIWSLQEPGGPLLLEEPEISLNSSVVEVLAPLISKAARRSKRQVLITTHSTHLVDNAVSAEEVFILKTTEQGTTIDRAADDETIVAHVSSGIALGDAVLPATASQGVNRLTQLDLFT